MPQARKTWPFFSRDPIEKLNRVCEVIGSHDDDRKDDGISDDPPSTTQGFAPRVSVILNEICENIIDGAVMPELSGPSRNPGSIELALKAVKT